ncbi:MAG: hypothetical protein E7234_05145 [Lachnospiraceae bacterium]|jgi:uncharacterized protein YfkK (UPF0435 family)|nr:hypothetical protein [Lachnospiraceae bacterium]
MLDILIFISMLTGITLTLYSLFKIRSEGSEKEKSTDTESLSRYMEEADEAAEDLHKLSQGVIEEINGKYQELIYLYNLIEEKEKKLTIPEFDAYAGDDYKKIPTKSKEASPPKTYFTHNPRYEEIYSLKKSGLSTGDIAKKLNMGQGEVALILELGKDNEYAP